MSGLSDFRRFFTSFLSLAGAGVASTALVLVTALVGLAPPWPVAIVQITAIAQLLVLVFVYQSMVRVGKTKATKYMKRYLIGLLALALSYLALHSLLIYPLPNGDLALRGFVCSQGASQLYGASCPFLEEVQIADAAYEDDRLWTPLGLLVARLALVAAWVGSFVCLVNVLAAFVVFQRRQA